MRTRPWFREISLVLRPLAWQMFFRKWNLERDSKQESPIYTHHWTNIGIAVFL